MRTLFIALFMLISFSGFAQEEEGIRFEDVDSLEAALKLAKEQNKLVFMDCYTTWCGPCVHLTKNIFPIKEVGDFYNANFINVKFDMEKDAGIGIAKKYHVRAYPTLLFLDANGEVVHKHLGAGDQNLVLNIGKTALDPDNNFRSVVSRLESGEINPELLTRYINSEGANAQTDLWIDRYFYSLDKDQRISPESWAILRAGVNEFNNDHFYFLYNNEKAFKEILDNPDEVDEKLLQVFTNAQRQFKSMEKIEHPMMEKARISTEMQFAQSDYYQEKDLEHWKKFINSAKAYFEAYEVDALLLNNTAWFVYENFKNHEDLESVKIAAEWARKSVEMGRNNFNLDTYAALLFELGEIKQAVELQKEAMVLVEKTGDAGMIQNYKERMDKFEQALLSSSDTE